MHYVIARNGYVGREYLSPQGRWTQHKDEALAFYGQASAGIAIEEIQKQVSYRVWSQH